MKQVLDIIASVVLVVSAGFVLWAASKITVTCIKIIDVCVLVWN